MPLIKCVDCGKEISDRARNCPNCGCPVICSVPTESSALDLGAFPPVPAMEQQQKAPDQQQMQAGVPVVPLQQQAQQVSQQQVSQQQVSQQQVSQQQVSQQQVSQQQVSQQQVSQQNAQQQNVQQQNVQQEIPVTPVVPVEAPVATPAKKKSGKKTVLSVILILLIVGALGVGGYLLYQEFWADTPAQPVIPAVSNQADPGTTTQSTEPGSTPTEQAPAGNNSATEPVVQEPHVVIPAALQGDWVGAFDQVSFIQDGDEAYLEVDTYYPEKRQWSHERIVIAAITDDTFILNNEETGAPYQYKLQDGALYVNERYYAKNKYRTDTTLAGYKESAMRFYGNIFHGMTREEILKYADMEYKKDGFSGEMWLELPPIIPEVTAGEILCYMDDTGKLKNLWIYFSAEKCVSQPETVLDALVDMYSNTYGATEKRMWSDAKTYSYDWIQGDLVIKIVDWDDGEYSIIYELR